MSNVRVSREPLGEVSLYIGSVEGYGGKPFSGDDVSDAVAIFQTDHELQYGYLCPVRQEKCRFISKDYREDGHELTVIRYPRNPRTDDELCDFIRRLGVYLLHKFKQNRISMVARFPSSGFVEMLESPDAEMTHKR